MTEQVADMMAKQKFGFEKADDIVKEIGPVNPLEDFRKMIHEKRTDLVDSALTQIQNVIRRLVEESVQGSYHSKALECLKEMRKVKLIKISLGLYNRR
jgi:ATP-dependent DNA helicase 2 subunit 2